MNTDLTALKEKLQVIERARNVACGIIDWRTQMAIGIEAARRGRPLTCVEELSIRASACDWQTRIHLDSLYIELERVNAQIASLNRTAASRH
ncbi:MAG TPA: hypothetical protein VNG71_05515 [Pyrinomonadaceae bacterium]|nr:hypothetical protein [Pyrinomonadaceae bacterium]